MFSYLFRQLFNSFGIFFRTIRAFFTRRFVGMGARLRRMTNFSRHATQVASKSFQGAATAMKKPTKREDYVETKWLFVSKSFLIMLALGLIALGCLIYFVIWPFLLSRFFTAHFWQENEKVESWSGKVVVYYDKEKDQPMYEGRLVEGVLQGKGTEYDEDGLVVYQGDFVDGEHTGEGTYYEEGVLTYEGDFSSGDYEGEGKLYQNGVLSYEGDFVKNVPSGVGTAYDETGTKLYQGDFVEGIYNGEGTLYNPNGKTRYKGDFVDGQFSGTGSLMDAEGALVYKGGFREDLYHGEGVLYDEEGDLAYEGEFQEGLFHGEGRYLVDGVRRYTGGYEKGQRSGEGVAYREDGSILYKGGFGEDLYNGDGTLYLEDDRGYITAQFVDGDTDGDIQWYIGGKLWYAGGAEELVPDGYGELYLRSGKKIYAGEMDRGTIDGQWVLSLTPDEVRAAFAEATIAERLGNDGSFFIMNQELGLVARCTMKTAEADSGVFSVWITRQNSDLALQDQLYFNIWAEDLETDPRMDALMPWTDVQSFAQWAMGLQEGGPKEHSQFPEHDMTKERFFLDGWYCTAAIDESAAEPVMVSWTTEGALLEPMETEEPLNEGVSAEQETMDALLETLGQGDSGQLTQGHMGYLLSQMETPDEAKVLAGHLIDLYENVHVLLALESSESLLMQQMQALQAELAMGKATQDEVDALRLRLDEVMLQITQRTAQKDKALLLSQSMVQADIPAYDLRPLMISVDPSTLDEITLCEKAKEYASGGAAADTDADAAGTDADTDTDTDTDTGSDAVQEETDALTLDVQVAKINLQIAYHTLQHQIRQQEQAVAAVEKAVEQYGLGYVDQRQLQELQITQATAMASTYSALAEYVRQLNDLNHLTGGWVAEQIGWLDTVFAVVYQPAEPAQTEAAG